MLFKNAKILVDAIEYEKAAGQKFGRAKITVRNFSLPAKAPAVRELVNSFIGDDLKIKFRREELENSKYDFVLAKDLKGLGDVKNSADVIADFPAWLCLGIKEYNAANKEEVHYGYLCLDTEVLIDKMERMARELIESIRLWYKETVESAESATMRARRLLDVNLFYDELLLCAYYLTDELPLWAAKLIALGHKATFSQQMSTFMERTSVLDEKIKATILNVQVTEIPFTNKVDDKTTETVLKYYLTFRDVSGVSVNYPFRLSLPGPRKVEGDDRLFNPFDDTE